MIALIASQLLQFTIVCMEDANLFLNSHKLLDEVVV